MQIRDVVGRGDRDVVTISPTETIADVVWLLDEYSIGAVVVTLGDSVIVGIVSERDIVQNLAREHEITLRLRVDDLMTKRVETCTPDALIENVMATMTAGHFRHMPVVNRDGQLCGIVSLGDLVDARLRQLETQNLELAIMMS